MLLEGGLLGKLETLFFESINILKIYRKIDSECTYWKEKLFSEIKASHF